MQIRVQTLAFYRFMGEPNNKEAATVEGDRRGPQF